MHKVLDGDMMKSEMLSHLSVTKRGHVSESDPGGSYSIRPLQVESHWLPMADYFCVCMVLPPLAVGSMPCNRLHWR